MKNIFNLIPRWHKITYCPIEGKERLAVDAAYNAIAYTCQSGRSVTQFIAYESDDVAKIEIFCSRETFQIFLGEFKTRSAKYIWRITKVSK